jgi:hypothetical protein
MIGPLAPSVTFTLKSRSTSAAPRIMASSWLTTTPRFWGFAYIDADMDWCAASRR